MAAAGFLAVAAPALLVFSAPAEAARKSDGNSPLQNTLVIIRDHNEPVAQKILTWIYATEKNLPVRAADLISFVRQNPDWPRQQAMREKIERNLEGSLGAQEIVAWMRDNPPSTYEGIKAYVGALRATGQESEARRQLTAFWQEKPLSKNEAASLAGTYAAWLTPKEHAARLDRLLWQGRQAEAEYMLAFVSPDIRALGRARIALAQMGSQAESYLASVPASLQRDEGLLYERLRWRRRRQMDAGALEIINQMPAASVYGDIWWKEQSILARREIEKKNYAAAYRIARRHNMTAGTDFAQAEWLMGWLSMLQGQHTQAYTHFTRMYDSVQSAISRSRGAYWAARASEKLRAVMPQDPAKPGAPAETYADHWDKIAAQYPSTFYGQLSYARYYGPASKAAINRFGIDAAAQQAFDQREIVRAVRLLKRINMPQFIDTFLSRMISDAKTRQDLALIARLAKDVGRPSYAVQANKEAQQRLGTYLFEEGFPTLPSLPASRPEKSLVHAIVYRESMFDPLVSSTAGALGLMQLMPATAKQTSAKIGASYTKEKLTSDPNYNVRLGSTYLQQMLDRYSGFYPLAIAAYNAGPGNVDKWLREVGDPRHSNVNLIDWIESIPIYETRNYVQRVMESYYMYRLRFDEKPRTVLDVIQP